VAAEVDSAPIRVQVVDHMVVAEEDSRSTRPDGAQIPSNLQVPRPVFDSALV
jgi:hypothetical protein